MPQDFEGVLSPKETLGVNMGRLCFQVDLDIMGPENSMRQDFIELEQQAFPWSVNGSNGPANGAVTLQVGLHMLKLDALL